MQGLRVSQLAQPFAPMPHQAATPTAMMALGADFARQAGPGDVFALVGGLGAGKTHWTKGFVAALGSRSEVTSPTFGLLHEYSDGAHLVYHLDFYRMKSAEEPIDLGWDELIDQAAILIIEWADLFPEIFPPHTRWLRFSPLDDGTRQIEEFTP